MSTVMHLKMKNLEELYREDISSGNGFLIDPNIDYEKIHKDDIFLQPTLYSRKYGIFADDPQEVVKYQYSCDCELIYGQINLGRICSNCETEVIKRDYPLSIRGWFNLGKFKILTPIAMYHIEDCIGKDNFDKFRRGRLKEYPLTSLPYRFESFMEDYGQHSTKSDKIAFLIQNKKDLFTSKIPVISKKTRFMLRIENIVPIYHLHELNEVYTDLNESIKWLLNFEKLSEKSIMIENLLLSVQKKIYGQSCKKVTRKRDMSKKKKEIKLHDNKRDRKDLTSVLLTKTGGDKSKILRGEVYAVRFPYTSRCVMTPLITERNDICTIPIDTFRGLFKEEIIEILHGMGYKLYDIMKITDPNFLLTKSEKLILLDILERLKRDNCATILVNRQPTLKFGNTNALTIITLEDNNVIRVPSCLLSNYNGDHDGDVFTSTHIDAEIQEDIRLSMGPHNHLLGTTREIDIDTFLTKDQQVLFFAGLEKC